MKQYSSRIIVLAAALAFSALGAGASINIGDQLTIADHGNYGPFDLSLTRIGYVNSGQGETPNLYSYAGPFDVTVHDITQNRNYSLFTFCTDVNADWNDNPTTRYTARTFTDPASVGVDPLWSHNPQAIQNAAWIYNTYFVGQTIHADQAAGIQLAIWKALYDTSATGTLNSLTFASGKFQATGFGGGLADAVGYVTALEAARTHGPFTVYNETWLDPNVPNSSQGLIYTPVPEPTTLIAGALLLLPFGASTLRILRRNRAA